MVPEVPGHGVGGPRDPVSLPPLHRPRQQPRLVRLHPGGEPAHPRASLRPLATADRPRSAPDGDEGRAHVRAPLHRSLRAQRGPRAHRRHRRPGHAHGGAPPGRGQDGGGGWCPLRRLLAGARLPAHPRRRPHPFRAGLGAHGDAAGAAVGRPRVERAVRRPHRHLELPRALAGRPLDPGRRRELRAHGQPGAPRARRAQSGVLAAQLRGRLAPRRHPDRPLRVRPARRREGPLRPRPPRGDPAPGGSGGAPGAEPLRGRRTALPGRILHSKDAAAVQSLRQAAPGAAAVSRPAPEPRRPPRAALRRHRPHPPPAHGRGRGGRAQALHRRPRARGRGLSRRGRHVGKRPLHRPRPQDRRARGAGPDAARRGSRALGHRGLHRPRTLLRGGHPARPRLVAGRAGAPHGRARRRGARGRRHSEGPRPARPAGGPLPVLGGLDGRGLDPLRIREADGRGLRDPPRRRRPEGWPPRALRRDRASRPDTGGDPERSPAGDPARRVHGGAGQGGGGAPQGVRAGRRDPGGPRHRVALRDFRAGARGEGRGASVGLLLPGRPSQHSGRRPRTP